MAEATTTESEVLDGKTSQSTTTDSTTTIGGEATKGESGAVSPEALAKLQVALPEGWQGGLPVDLKDEPSLKLFKDFPSIVKSLVSAQKMIGKDKIVIPDSKLATKEDWRDFYMKVGLPEVADKYEVKIDPKLYENGAFEEGKVGEFKKVAHDLNMLPHQLQGVLDWLGKEGETSIQELEDAKRSANSEELTKYKKESGEKFEYNKARANQALKVYGGDEFTKWVKEAGLASSVPLIKFLASVGETLKEDVMVGRGAHGGPLMTPSEIESKINAVKSDMGHAYWVAEHPGHKQAIKEMEELHERLADSKSA